jgi:hypothetical protein
MTASQSGRRRSKARAPCQQQAKAAITKAAPAPIANNSPAKPRTRNNSVASAPNRNVALHQANQVERISLSQKIRNRAPSNALMKMPKSRTVKESICMEGLPLGAAWGRHSHSMVPGGFEVTS